MPKPMYVWTGTAWVSVASEVESLATYATQSYADNQPGMKLIVPSSVSVGSGSGSVSAQGTVNFTSASSVSINDVFSATYDNYFMVINHTGTADASLECRLRVSGADNSTANYDSVQIAGTGGTPSSATSAGQTSWVRFGSNTWAGRATTTAYIFDPYNTQRTTFQAALNGYYSSSAVQNKLLSGSFGLTTSFTGFTIINGSGNITGSLKVYGLKNG